jgi:hypothetical protein
VITAQVYLEEDLRVDFSVLQSVDTEIIRLCAEAGKKVEVGLLLKFSLQITIEK